MYMPNTFWTWAFMITTIVQAVVVLALESYVFAEFQLSLTPGLPAIPPVKVIPTYLTLFIFGFLYEVVLVYDSLRLKNTIQVLGLCMYNVGMLIYAAVQGSQIQKSMYILYKLSPSYLPREDLLTPLIQGVLIAVPVLIGLATIVMVFTAAKLYNEFAWTIYKHISADIRMKRRFLTFQIYIALLKFDFFFFLGFTVQFIVVVTTQSDAEFYVTIAAIPIMILMLVLAGRWTRNENKIGTILTIILYLCGLAYFIFKLARMYQPAKAVEYEPVRTSLTIFAVITVILIVMTITNACVCISNFDKGLKPFVENRRLTGEEEKIDHTTELPNLKHAMPPSRMEID